MHEVTTQAEYYEVVEQLYLEFQSEIEDGCARNIANQLVGTFRVSNGIPLVYHSAEYEGGAVETLNERLNPFDILGYTDIERLPGRRKKEQENASIRAQECLTLDLLDQLYADEGTNSLGVSQ